MVEGILEIVQVINGSLEVVLAIAASTIAEAIDSSLVVLSHLANHGTLTSHCQRT